MKLPKPPPQSGWISLGLAGLPLLGCFLLYKFLLDPTLGMVGFVAVVAGAPLAAAYSVSSLKTTSDRSLAVLGFLLSLAPIGGMVLLIVAVSNFKLG